MKNKLIGILNAKSMCDEEKFRAILALATDLPEEQTQVDDQGTVNPEIVQARQAEEAFMMLISTLGKLQPEEAMVNPNLCWLIAKEAQNRSFAPTKILLDTIPPASVLNDQLQLFWKIIEEEAGAK